MALRRAMAQIVPLVGAAASTTGASRAFGTSGLRASDAQKESIASFMKDFASVKPSTMDDPSTPSDFMRTLKEMPTSIPDKLTLNFYMPHDVEFAGVEVEQVQIPATTGDFGVLPGHVPTVAQMRPGVVAVTKSSSEVHKVRADRHSSLRPVPRDVSLARPLRETSATTRHAASPPSGRRTRTRRFFVSQRAAAFVCFRFRLD